MMEMEKKISSIFNEVFNESKDENQSIVHDAHGVTNFCSTVAYSQIVTKDFIIENQDEFDFYEKVSLMFLLHDNIEYALQKLRLALQAYRAGSMCPDGLLADWVSSVDLEEGWQNKYLEALCIMQNFRIIQEMGISAPDAVERFLPNRPESSLFVNGMRKALYYMCETLAASDLEQLVKRVHEEAAQKGHHLETLDAEFMEINILYWASQKIIRLENRNGQKIDVSCLLRHLKQMQKDTLVNILEDVTKVANRNLISQATDMSSHSASETSSCSSSSLGSEWSSSNSSGSSNSQCSVTSQRVGNLSKSTEERYLVDPENVGLCVIINQKTFYKEKHPYLQSKLPIEPLPTRLGTDMDRERLSEAFGTRGFTILRLEFLTHQEMIEALEEVLDKKVMKNHSCFALCILSHGKRGAVYGCNSIPVAVEEIENMIKNCIKLINKPKILIIQACQGPDQLPVVDSDIVSDGPKDKGAVQSTDFITFWSTVPGYVAFRHEIEGTWFVKELCKAILRAEAEEDLQRTFSNVIRHVSRLRAVMDNQSKAMVPIISSTFTKLLYLPRVSHFQLKVAKHIFERHMFEALVREFLLKGLREAAQKRAKEGKLNQHMDFSS